MIPLLMVRIFSSVMPSWHHTRFQSIHFHGLRMSCSAVREPYRSDAASSVGHAQVLGSGQLLAFATTKVTHMFIRKSGDLGSACKLATQPDHGNLSDTSQPTSPTRRFAPTLLRVAIAFLAPTAALVASSAASAARDPGGVHWPMSQSAHRAIFCGEPDTQTGFEYSTALNGALSQLTRVGHSLPQAMDILRGRARCAVGRELPDLESKPAPMVTPSLIGVRP